MSRFFSRALSGLEAYVPGEQPQDRSYIKLNTNESPYPPSPSVLKVINSSQAELLRLYPDPTCKRLKEALAREYGLSYKNIFVSNSSDEVLGAAFTAYCAGSGRVYFADITYGFYKVFAELQRAKVTVISLRDDLSICCRDYFDLEPGLIVIANPNAPTGIALPAEDIRKIALSNKDSVVLVDEAYVDFGGESSVSLISELKNLIVTRTYSKSMSMAGARLGFAMADPELISDLERIKYSTNPYSVNRLSLEAGIAALEEMDYYRENCKRIAMQRDKTTKELEALGFSHTESRANFIFAKSDSVPGKRLFERLRSAGILVRRFDAPRIGEYLRITVGTENDMAALVAEIERIVEDEKRTDSKKDE